MPQPTLNVPQLSSLRQHNRQVHLNNDFIEETFAKLQKKEQWKNEPLFREVFPVLNDVIPKVHSPHNQFQHHHHQQQQQQQQYDHSTIESRVPQFVQSFHKGKGHVIKPRAKSGNFGAGFINQPQPLYFELPGGQKKRQEEEKADVSFGMGFLANIQQISEQRIMNQTILSPLSNAFFKTNASIATQPAMYRFLYMRPRGLHGNKHYGDRPITEMARPLPASPYGYNYELLCNGVPYDNQRYFCCGGRLIRIRPDPFQMCCGDVYYDNVNKNPTLVCCGNRVCRKDAVY